MKDEKKSSASCTHAFIYVVSRFMRQFTYSILIGCADSQSSQEKKWWFPIVKDAGKKYKPPFACPSYRLTAEK